MCHSLKIKLCSCCVILWITVIHLALVISNAVPCKQSWSALIHMRPSTCRLHAQLRLAPMSRAHRFTQLQILGAVLIVVGVVVAAVPPHFLSSLLSQVRWYWGAASQYSCTSLLCGTAVTHPREESARIPVQCCSHACLQRGRGPHQSDTFLVWLPAPDADAAAFVAIVVVAGWP